MWLQVDCGSFGMSVEAYLHSRLAHRPNTVQGCGCLHLRGGFGFDPSILTGALIGFLLARLLPAPPPDLELGRRRKHLSDTSCSKDQKKSGLKERYFAPSFFPLSLCLSLPPPGLSSSPPSAGCHRAPQQGRAICMVPRLRSQL